MVRVYYYGDGGAIVDADYQVYLEYLRANGFPETGSEDGDEEEEEYDDGDVVVVDPDYNLYLELPWKNNYEFPEIGAMGENFDGHSCSIEEDDDDNDDGGSDSLREDSQYKLLLEHLRPCGKSYALVIPEHNLYIKYNDESESSSTVSRDLSECPTKNANHVSDEVNAGLGEGWAHVKCMGKQCMQPKAKSLRRPDVKNFNGGSNCVASGAQNHGHNNGIKRRMGRPRKNALENFNGGSYAVALEAPNHPVNNGVKQGKGSPRMLTVKNSNGSNNLVPSDAQNRGGNNGVKRSRARLRKDASRYSNGGNNLVPSEARNHGGNNGVKRNRGRPRKDAGKNSNGGINFVASEAQNHDGGNGVKRRRVSPKMHAVKNSNGGNNLVPSEARNRGGNNGVKRSRGRPRKDASKNSNGGINLVASEAQNHDGGNVVKRRRVSPKMHAVKNSNGDNNLVPSAAQNLDGNNGVKWSRGRPRKDSMKNSNGSGKLMDSEAQNHAGNNGSKRRWDSSRKHNVNGKGRDQIIDHGTKRDHAVTPSGIAAKTEVKIEIEDFDYKATLKKRPVQDPELKLISDGRDNQANARKLTDYRVKLLKELKRPYCEMEYVRCLKDINDKKPVQYHRELGGGHCKSYKKKGRLGKSLLEHHVDLSRKIDAVRHDHPRVLNLLRGFFFWLKNVSNEESFMPWTDPRLNLLPQQPEPACNFKYS